jgi:hypothetical protein
MEPVDRLVDAIAHGDENAARKLAHDISNLNKVSTSGFAPLCIAAFWGYTNIIQHLLSLRFRIFFFLSPFNT